jgi:hypothetical protein
MIHAQDAKVVDLIIPQSVASNSTVSGYVDTRGFDYLEVDLHLGTVAATSSITKSIALSESDTTAFVASDVITTFVGSAATSTSVGFVWPTVGVTSSYQIIRMGVNLIGRKRYIELYYGSPAVAITACGTARLSRAGEMPNTAAEAGVTKLILG